MTEGHEHDRLLNVPGTAAPPRLTPEREREIRRFHHTYCGLEGTACHTCELLRELGAVRGERDKWENNSDEWKELCQRHRQAEEEWKRRALEAEGELAVRAGRPNPHRNADD